LSLDQPLVLERFLAALTNSKPHLSQLIILGDLFDSWVGDDSLPLPLAQTVVAAITALKMPVALCVGNRDFLLGQTFAAAIGAQLLGDETVFTVDCRGLPNKILLAHGDQWCTADVEYQRFRKNARASAWQQAFLAQPLEQRLGLAARLRMESETAKLEKTTEIMDVAATAIAGAFTRYEVNTLIHGHTHRPGAHKYNIEGTARWRHVLPDWGIDRGEIRTLSQIAAFQR
jgi:UDP-2,3-diacylglucosamine hydrolase